MAIGVRAGGKWVDSASLLQNRKGSQMKGILYIAAHEGPDAREFKIAMVKEGKLAGLIMADGNKADASMKETDVDIVYVSESCTGAAAIYKEENDPQVRFVNMETLKIVDEEEKSEPEEQPSGEDVSKYKTVEHGEGLYLISLSIDDNNESVDGELYSAVDANKKIESLLKEEAKPKFSIVHKGGGRYVVVDKENSVPVDDETYTKDEANEKADSMNEEA